MNDEQELWPDLPRKPMKKRKIPNSNVTICGRRFCSRCGRWRFLMDFLARDYTSRGVPTSWQSDCRTCKRAMERLRGGGTLKPRRVGRETSSWEQRKEYFERDEQAREDRREYERIYAEGQRRAAGIPPRRFRVSRSVDTSKATVPVAPLQTAVQAWLRAHPSIEGYEGGGQSELALRSGVPERRIYGLLSGESSTITLHTADRLALAIDSHLDLIYVDDAGLVAA